MEGQVNEVKVVLTRHPWSDVRSYRCVEGGVHERCTGLVSPNGTVAYLCNCNCGCNDRARARHGTS